MTFTSGCFSAGAGTSSARFGATRGRISGSVGQGVNYPSPFFDVAHTYLPTTVKQLFQYCRYYFLTNPLINATVFKLSEYPITDIIIDHEDPVVKRRWMEYYNDILRYRMFQVETGLDYFTYGNCMVSLSFPFQKYLSCASCGFTERADKIKQFWRFTNYQFRLDCPKCHATADAKAFDHYYKNASGIGLLRWNVEDVDISYNDITGESKYFYTIPRPIQSDVAMGKKDSVSTVPQIFIEALRKKKGVVFSKDNLFHLKRPTLAWNDRGWGTPIVLPVLKDTFYLQIMKKAQEAVLLEHIVPLRLLFPQAASGTSDPFTTVNLVDWRDHVATEISRWRLDHNYMPILPLPIGQQSVGGDGKALLLFNEMTTLSEHIIMGLGVPREFLMGGLSYSGSNVSMRMLENAFISYVGRHRLMARWIMKMVAHYMDWPEVNIRFKPFKMADDLQRKAYLFQLNQAGKISDETLLADADLDQTEEDEIMIAETDKRLEATKKQQLAMAEVQGEQQVIMMKMQAKAQESMAAAQGGPLAPGEPGGPEGGAPPQGPPPGPEGAMQGMGSQLNAGQDLGVPPEQAEAQGAPMGMDINQMAQSYAEQIMQMAPEEQQMALDAIANQSPELAQLTAQILAQLQAEQPPPPSPISQQPLPEQLPPRRDAALV